MSPKTKKTIVAIIAILMVIAMVLPMASAAIR